jgi:hypothetical protein
VQLIVVENPARERDQELIALADTSATLTS